jgi:FkbM family methyltransferase
MDRPVRAARAFLDLWLGALPSPLLVPPWLLYRRARLLAFTILGRNALCSGRHAPRWDQQRCSIQAWLDSSNFQARLAGRRRAGPAIPAALATLARPEGTAPEFLDIVWSEVRGRTYDLTAIDPRGAVLLDCGANIGLFSLWALSLGVAHVVAFEPSPSNRICLERNLATAIAAGACTVVPQGLAAASGWRVLRVSNTANPGGHHLVDEARPGDLSIEVATIDETVDRLGLTRLDFVKMDVEGSEVEALRGARETIRRFRPVLGVATEHTADPFANALAVIEVVRGIDPAYDWVATSARPDRMVDGRLVMVPFVLQFAVRDGRS